MARTESQNQTEGQLTSDATVPAGSYDLLYHNDARAQAAYMAQAFLGNAFGDIAFDVSALIDEAHTTVSGLQQDTARAAMQYAPQAPADTAERETAVAELASRLEIIAMDTNEFERGLCAVIAHAIKWGYVAGRLDQINDMEGTNAERFVRARELPGVIVDAQSVNGSMLIPLDDDLAEYFASQRNRLKQM